MKLYKGRGDKDPRVTDLITTQIYVVRLPIHLHHDAH